MKEIYCTKCREVTPHLGEEGKDNDLLFLCSVEGCGHFVKLPMPKDKEELASFITEHEVINKKVAEEAAEQEARKALVEELLS